MTRIVDDRRAVMFALAAVLCWSTVASAFKLSLRWLDVEQLLLYSALTASLCLYTILVVQQHHAEPWRLPLAAYKQPLLLGLLNPFAYYLILLAAYDRLPAQVALALNYTWAITLMLLSVPLLKHRVTRGDIAGTALCYGGVLAVCFGGATIAAGKLDAIGIALALGSTLIWALYWIFKARDTLDPVVSLFLSFLFSLPFLFVACILFSTLAPAAPAGLLGALYIGVFEMGVTYVFWLLALQHASSAAKVSTLIFCSPFLSLFFIHVFVGEPVAAGTLAGLVLIALGLWIQQRGAAPTNQPATT